MSDPVDPVDLTAEPIRSAIDSAAADGHPVAVAYVDERGRPSQSLRGSTHVHDRDRLAIWARRADTGLAAAVARNEAVSLVSTSPRKRANPSSCSRCVGGRGSNPRRPTSSMRRSRRASATTTRGAKECRC